MKSYAGILGGLAALMVWAPSAAHAQKTPIQILDVFKIEHASDPRISPDGEKIVYVRNFADIDTDERYSNLWIVNFDGSNHQALTGGNVSAHSPRWSPDGTRLAYISNAHIAEGDKDSKPQIYVRDMATGEAGIISDLDQAPSGIEWSPDGSQIAFAMLKPAPAPIVEALPEAPAGATWKAGSTYTDKLVYRFNGAGYLPHGYNHIYVMPSSGGAAKQVSRGDYHHAGPGRRAGPLSWSADGRSVLVSANRRDDADIEAFDTEVYSFRVGDGRMRQHTDRRGPDSDAAFSPDGKWIAYTGFDDERLGAQIGELYVQQANGAGRRSLTAGLDRTVHAFRWAPDGAGLYFAYDNEGVTKLAYVRLDGERRDVMSGARGGEGYTAYGESAQFTLAGNGRIAVVKGDASRVEDIAVGEAGGEFRYVTDLNGDLFAEREIGAVEMIWYDSSVDGRKVQGWLVHPPGFDPKKKYPLLIEIHGGPFTNYGDRFDFEKQYFAARGYVVLYTNPRGSTSYGKEFSNLIHHAYPGDDFYDLDSGVDAAIARGYIDENRLYVSGGSGGGVLTSWMISRTDRFKAAIIDYPVIEWESFNLTTDIPWVNNYWFPGFPWNNREHYFKRSLLSVVDKVKTPSLLITGEGDWRTPISQTEQYYAALKLLGVEAVMIRIPDEPHGTRVHPSHFMTRLVNTVGWMDKHK